MRTYFLYAATLAGTLVLHGFSLTQASADSFSLAEGHASEFNADGIPTPAPPRRPFSGFSLDDLFNKPGDRAPKQKAQPNHQPATAPKSEADRAEQLKKALTSQPPPEARRKQMLDALFERLHKAGDPEQARAIAASIERIWLQSGSDTADLLMQRATASMQAQQYSLALSLFDKLVALEPDWAEAWNQRATTRFLTGDTDGAMADIDRVIKLEPRHFSALAGMGMILQGEGLDKRALEIFKKALGIYPLEQDIQKLVEKLTLEVEGQDI
jgi:tetratricopeptide (TPR) repeat protein